MPFDRAPQLLEFTEKFSTWLDTCFHVSRHTGDSMDGHTPSEVYEASWNGASKRDTSRESLDLMLMKETRPLKVGKNGVRWDGLGYGQYDPDLIKMFGKEVYLRIDERDVNGVLVFTVDDQFVCHAPCNTRLPFKSSNELLRQAKRNKHRVTKVVNDFREVRPQIHADLTDHMITMLRSKGLKVYVTSVQKWRRKYRLSVCSAAALIDQRGNRGGPTDLSAYSEFLEVIRSLWRLPILLGYSTFAKQFESAYMLAVYVAEKSGHPICCYRLAEKSLRSELLPSLPQKSRRNVGKAKPERR